MLVIIVTVVLLEMSQCGCSLYLNILYSALSSIFMSEVCIQNIFQNYYFFHPSAIALAVLTSFTFGLWQL